jgi:hypothetical protein
MPSFQGAVDVDVRNSKFYDIHGNQYNIGVENEPGSKTLNHSFEMSSVSYYVQLQI